MHDLTLTSDNWQARANCRNVDPETMQPEIASREQVELAKRVCDGCPVREQCLQMALDNPGSYGVHGGRWFGPPPQTPLATHCAWCSEPLEDCTTSPSRPTRIYCGDKCRKRAKRARERNSAA